MPKKLLFIGGPIFILLVLVAVTFVFDVFGARSAIFGSAQVSGEMATLNPEAKNEEKPLSQYDKFLQETIKLERQSLQSERVLLDEQLVLLEQRTQTIKKREQELQALDVKLAESQSNLVDQEKELSDKRRALEVREEQVKELERQKEENRPIPLPAVSFSQEAKDREHKKMAKGFSTMRAKEVANILDEMLKRGDEGRSDVLSLLRKTDNSTRMRILSVIAKDDIKTATELTQTLMLPASN